MTREDDREGDPRSPVNAAPSDHSLLRRFRRGDQDGATAIYLRYAHRLRGFVRAKRSPQLAQRVDVEDIVQSVFRSFFEGVSHGDYEVPAGEELWKLFLVIALNKIRVQGRFHRAAKRDVRQTQSSDLGAGAMEEPSQDDSAYAFLELVVDEVLGRLPTAHRTMIEKRIAGYEIAEIAEQTRRSKRTIERVLQEFRKRLHALLHEDDATGPRK